MRGWLHTIIEERFGVSLPVYDCSGVDNTLKAERLYRLRFRRLLLLVKPTASCSLRIGGFNFCREIRNATTSPHHLSSHANNGSGDDNLDAAVAADTLSYHLQGLLGACYFVATTPHPCSRCRGAVGVNKIGPASKPPDTLIFLGWSTKTKEASSHWERLGAYQ